VYCALPCSNIVNPFENLAVLGCSPWLVTRHGDARKCVHSPQEDLYCSNVDDGLRRASAGFGGHTEFDSPRLEDGWTQRQLRSLSTLFRVERTVRQDGVLYLLVLSVGYPMVQRWHGAPGWRLMALLLADTGHYVIGRRGGANMGHGERTERW
jgi:hypothetical protein